MGKTAFVFPGQGAQYVGMAKDFSENFPLAKQIFEEASDSLGFNMEKLCFEGPQEELVKTENTQPAILTASIAMLKVLQREGLSSGITAGLSLGEYGALVNSKVFSFADAVKLVKKRGKYMQEAVPPGKGTMAAILGLDKEQMEACIAKSSSYGVVEAANYNSPGQIVISGEVPAVEEAVKKALESGAKKAVVLPVSAPFHSSLLKPAGEKLLEDLKAVNVCTPEIPVVSNVNAKILSSKEEVIPVLVKQVSNPVLWQESVEFMIEQEVTDFIEIGPGKTLSAFIKRIAKTVNKAVNIYNVEDLDSFKAVIHRFQQEGGF